MRRMRQAFADFWLQFLFFWAGLLPWVPRVTKPFWMATSWFFSRYLRFATTTNARRILGPDASDADITQLGKKTIASFYDFICDIARTRGWKLEEFTKTLGSVEGESVYEQARTQGRGAVLVTAHFGSFEVGMASVRLREPKVHTLFHRDRLGFFDGIRDRLHRQLGVIDQPLEDGLQTWASLRDALRRDEVVLIQGDRVMPGQRGRWVPLLHDRVQLPVGPVKLARLSGAPLIPVFAIRQPDGRVRMELEAPIDVNGPMDAVLQRLADAIARRIEAHPEQWHVLQPVFESDIKAKETDPELRSMHVSAWTR